MTWSILVRDPATGALGAAVATRFFAVGALAIHVEGGIAALATQALINPMYALHGMARLRAGESPDTVAAALLAADAGRDHRQLHMIDAQAASPSTPARTASPGAAPCEARTSRSPATCWPARRWWNARWRVPARHRPLAERLLIALDAGEAAGGDKRGKQSAALKVCYARSVSGSRHPHRRPPRPGARNCAACTPSARSGSPCSAVSSPAPTARAACSTAR